MTAAKKPSALSRLGERIVGTGTPSPSSSLTSLAVHSELKAMKSDRSNLLVVPVADVMPDPNQPRKSFPAQEQAELQETIRAVGILQPITVRVHPEIPGKYMIVLGERRWRSVSPSGLNWETMEVHLVEWDDTKVAVAQLIENSEDARTSVKPWEEAQAYRSLVERLGSQQEVVAATGISKSRISKRLSLLDLPTLITDLIAKGILNDAEMAGQLKVLHGIAPQKAGEIIARAIKDGRLDRGEVRAAIRAVRSPTAANNFNTLSGEFSSAIRRFATQESRSKVKAQVTRGRGNWVTVQLQLPSEMAAKDLLETLKSSASET